MHDATKVLRQIYIGNLPPNLTPPSLLQLINSSLVQLGFYEAHNAPALNSWIAPDTKFGFVDLRAPEDAAIAIQRLNGMTITHAETPYVLRISRPKNYPSVPGLQVAVPVASVLPGVIASLGVNTPFLPSIDNLSGGAGCSLTSSRPTCVMITNLPAGMQDSMVQELASPFGTLRAYNTVPMNGYTCAVFEYESAEIAAQAATGLATIELGARLQVQLIPLTQASMLLRPVGPPKVTPSPRPSPIPKVMSDAQFARIKPSCVLCLASMVQPEDLRDDDSYRDLVEDTREECAKSGRVLQVEIPRSGADVTGPNLGSECYVYVQFGDEVGAAAAQSSIDGRRFGGQQVRACFYPAELFAQRLFILPEGYVPGEAAVPEAVPVPVAEEAASAAAPPEEAPPTTEIASETAPAPAAYIDSDPPSASAGVESEVQD